MVMALFQESLLVLKLEYTTNNLKQKEQAMNGIIPHSSSPKPKEFWTQPFARKIMLSF
jgi:hypothetical protein